MKIAQVDLLLFFTNFVSALVVCQKIRGERSWLVYSGKREKTICKFIAELLRVRAHMHTVSVYEHL